MSASTRSERQVGQAYFYHLTRSDMAGVVATLLGKCIDAGWRIELRGPDAERLKWLDEKLWLGPKEGFLAHGLAGGPYDTRQQILLCGPGQVAANSPQALMAIDGAHIDAAEVDTAERALVLFDGGDEDAVARARGQWKTLTDAGCAARYWSEDGGAWSEKASKNV